MSQDAYRLVAGRYDRLFEPMNKGLRLLGVRMFRPPKGMAVLDVGCGTGAHLELYGRLGCELYGIDASPSMLGLARKRLGQAADLRLGDASNMPYEDGSFDLVVAMLVLHEMDAQVRSSAIDEMERVLKDSGRVLLIDYHRGPSRPFEEWRNKVIILLSEVAAGRRHFRNYRHFLRMKGLPALVSEHSLVIEKERVVGGGAIALFLVGKP
jgi:ubiquinone/menaquinone biosynthesis C-methylase UbiE